MIQDPLGRDAQVPWSLLSILGTEDRGQKGWSQFRSFPEMCLLSSGHPKSGVRTRGDEFVHMPVPFAQRHRLLWCSLPFCGGRSSGSSAGNSRSASGVQRGIWSSVSFRCLPPWCWLLKAAPKRLVAHCDPQQRRQWCNWKLDFCFWTVTFYLIILIFYY